MRFSLKQRYRLYGVLALMSGLGFATYLFVLALKQNINFFFSPKELSSLQGQDLMNKRIRVGGVVKQGSIQHLEGLKIQFVLTDFKRELRVYYTGLLPDLLTEGRGVVVTGLLKSNPVDGPVDSSTSDFIDTALKRGVFLADELLVKHDERYSPR